ncbi:MAG: phosphoribosylformylglycinamidine synthase subunit PurL [Actinobacteria bacterium HGW-Actinobacteria-7]|nr:MAG: phosphoribosylformylglycinamidine synthase subunit PurL [Actinobacteria bacterium HGW-Actinobacteria-7]
MPLNDLAPELAPTLAVELGLKLDEYEKVVGILGRTPSVTELYMYSLMWSEHCSYKHSRKALRMFPTEGEHVLQGPGENAGVISVGDGWAVAFKMESHNHPSAIEPYQGAATGVGGIIRDIFTMGARPIASLDSLRFGTLDKPRQRYLFEGSVAGIGGYGNCLGVPTVGGEVYFEEAYEGNCLINAMSIGLMREEKLMRAIAAGPGNLVLLIGSTTGRDGIGGASVLASQEFDERAEDKRPAVQVGDPFEEKLLIEACLELLDEGLLVGLGDLGAAGLTSSASEMASRGGVGLDIDVTKIPARELEMKPFEFMVSESQERMLAVVEPGKLQEAIAVCTKWGLRSTVIGSVTDTGRFVVRQGGDIVADMPAATLAHDAPIYDPAMERPAYLDELQAFDAFAELDLPEDPERLSEVLLGLLASPNICSRQWIWQQYDHQVMLNSVVLPGSDAAVLRIGDTGRGEMTNRAIAASSDCNGRYCYLDPYTGAQIAFAEAARNVACSGGEPAAITDCLNFGNPEKPEVFWTFHESIRGLSDACKAFGVPVISGNVSFYNESFGSPIYPTPTVGLVGLLDHVDQHCTAAFKDEGDVIVLVGETLPELGGSEYLKVEHETVAGMPPAIDLELERDVQRAVIAGIRGGLVKSAHDCSEGGIAVAIAESCVAGDLGADVHLDDELHPVASLFSETQSRIVATVAESDAEAFIESLVTAGVPYSVIGTVEGDSLQIEDRLSVTLDEMREAFLPTLEQLVHGGTTVSTEELFEG